MAQQQREENSVLFSLKELRRMEDDRIRQEHDDRVGEEQKPSVRNARRRNVAPWRRPNAAAARKRIGCARRGRAQRPRRARSRCASPRPSAAPASRANTACRRSACGWRSSRARHNSPMKAIAVAVGVVVVLAGGAVFKLRSDQPAPSWRPSGPSALRYEQEFAKREAGEPEEVPGHARPEDARPGHRQVGRGAQPHPPGDGRANGRRSGPAAPARPARSRRHPPTRPAPPDQEAA